MPNWLIALASDLDGTSGTLLMAGVVFVVVLAVLHGLVRLYEAARLKRRSARPAAAAEVASPAVGDEGLALDDWQQLLKQADRRLGEKDDGPHSDADD
ncbi:MAG TPA: hypothetical protein EYH07_17965 [Kiloniellaceae bacterium]|nr:hypothetical protein [Kiloniellaceae bacterium]HIP80331.1 hypothetical protein [Kiloniellaceae bacterium]